MEEQDVRDRAEALCAALVSGDIGQAIEVFSPELQRNLGEVVSLLPLPSSEATVESVERGGGSGYTVVLRLVGETEEVLLQTRWKEREDRIVLIELSHLSKSPSVAEETGEDQEGDESTGA